MTTEGPGTPDKPSSGGAIDLRVKVIPRAPATGIRGRMADGTLKIALSSPPADGKANEELKRFLAGEFGTCRSSVTILSGATSRRKLVRVFDHTLIPSWLKDQDHS